MGGPQQALPEEVRRQVPSSSPVFETTGEDNLRITSFNSVASAEVTIRLRFINRKGEIVDQEFIHTPATDRTAGTSLFKLGDGWLINAIAFASGGTPLIGQTFIRLDVIRGLSGAVIPVAVLLQGYLKDTEFLTWPGTTHKNSVEGPGVIRSVTGTDPAANTEISETVPTGARWKLLSLRASLVTDANVANRQLQFIVDDGSSTYYRMEIEATQAASLTRSYVLAHSLGFQQTAFPVDELLVGISLLTKLAGHRIRTSTINRQAGDDWTAPVMLVEEWIEQ